MDTEKIESFNVIGIQVRTTNENGQAAQDIPSLWTRFMTERTIEQIPRKIDDTVYCIYTDYEKDHTKPYTAMLGCKVEDLNNIPNGMTGKIIGNGEFARFVAKGNIMQGAVFQAWTKIWNTDLNRSYTADFEVYNEKSQDPQNAEVDIFIAVK